MSNAELQAAHAEIQRLNAEGQKVVSELAAARQQVAAAAAAAAAASAASSSSSSAGSSVSSSRPPGPLQSKLKAPPTPVFKGEMGSAVDSWLRSLQKQFTFYGIGSVEFPDPQSCVNYAVMYLEGPALEWWDQLPTKASISSMSEFETALRARFRPMQAAHVARQRIASLKQRGRVSGYCDLFLSQLMPIKDMGAADQIFFFRQGLDSQLALEVLKKDPATLHEAMQYAVAAEAYLSRGIAGGNRGSGSGYYGPSHAPAGARAALASGDSPMDINHVGQPYDAYDSSLPSPTAANQPSSADAAATTDNTAMLAMMQQMQQQLLALQQQKPSGPTGKIPHLKPGDIDRLRAEGRCFNCKEKGHSKRDCNKPLRLKW